MEHFVEDFWLMSSDFIKGIFIDWYTNIHSSDNKASWLLCKIAGTLVAWTSVDFILNQRLNPYHQRRKEIYTATKQATGMSPNSVGLKDKYVFVKSTVLIKNPPYYNEDIVEKSDHHDFRMAIWPPYRLLSGAGMLDLGWQYHN